MKIHILPPEEARKIAAGEVIDRPASLVRELLDNAIDAGGRFIETIIEDGGCRRIEIIDDGCGMEKQDLEVCYCAHATSKIQSLDDLNRSRTLGFRGEALAAAAAVSSLDILTSTDGREAWRLEIGPGEAHPPTIERSRRTKGSSVRCFGLFDTIPARKRFLKRDWSEANLCYQVFADKALAFPGISFRFIQNGKSKKMLQSVSSFGERFADMALDRNEMAFLHEIKGSGEGFSLTIIIGGSELARNDRRQQYLIANGRRIQDFSLLQALEYGVQGVFPNGTHPVGAIFITVEPELADFNIHPAKREVHFADSGAIHHAITSALREFCSNQLYRHQPPSEASELEHREGSFGWETAQRLSLQQLERQSEYAPPQRLPLRDSSSTFALETLLENRPQFARLPERGELVSRTPDAFEAMNIYDKEPEEVPAASTSTVMENQPAYGLRYAGRAFNLFIMVEKGERLFFIDQHAAHERILYEQFLAVPILKQELLVSIPFNTESEEDDRFLTGRKQDLERLGVVIDGERGAWRIEALPVNWRLGDAATVKAILELRFAGENILERWAATLSCHSAIKDGDYLDETTALAIATAAFALPLPRCPHGRPIWFEIDRGTLNRAVKRV
jgi:DNA mismatch repair protein MutL